DKSSRKEKEMKNRKVKAFIALLMAGVMAAGMMGCGGGSGSGEEASAGGGSGDNTVTIWATGSDNVRQIYETLIENFNNSEYAGDYTAELQFMLSGTGTQSLTDMLVA